MPLNLPTRVAGPPAILDAQRDVDGDGVGYFEALPAAFRRENATLNLVEFAARKLQFGIGREVDDSFNPYTDTEGTIVERYPDALVGVTSQEEKDLVIQGLHREESDLEVLAGSGGMGILGMITAGILDPLMFIPVGAAFRATRVAKLLASGAKVSPGGVRTAAITARTGLLAASGAEVALHLNQETRTAEESAVNISAAVLLSGILGGAGHLISKELREAAVRQIDQDIGGVAGGSGEVHVTPDELTPHADGSPNAATIKVAQGFGIPTAMALARFSPMTTRLVLSPSQVAKKWLLRLADQNIVVKGFNEGASVESRLRAKFVRIRDDLASAERDLYKQYRQRTKGSKLQLKRKEFVKNSGEAQRVDSDVHGYTKEGRVVIEPEAKQLAVAHNEMYEGFAEEMVALNMLPEEVAAQGPKFAARYLRRRYLVDKIQQDRDALGGRRFEGIVRGWMHETLTAEERAFAVKLRPDLSESEAVEAAIVHGAESITDHIVGLAPGQGVVGRPHVPGGSPLQQRVMAWDDERVIDYLDNDISSLTDQYIRTVGPRIELFKMDAKATAPLPAGARAPIGHGKFVTVKEGDVIYPKGREPSHQLPNAIQEIREEYKALNTAAEGPKAVAKLQKEMKRDLRVVEAFRDRLMGTYGTSGMFQGLQSGLRITRALNLTAQLGGVAVSSIPDVAMPIFRNGLTRTFRAAATATLHPKTFLMSAAESKLTGGASELGQRVRFLELAELGGRGASDPVEGFVNKVTAPFSMATLIGPWNQFFKTVSGATFQTRLIEVSEALASGRKVKAWELNDMAQVRLQTPMLERIAAQHAASGSARTGRGGLKFADTARWTDDEARLAYRAAVSQQINNTILTPGIADRPLLMSTEYGKSLGQYKAFAFAATGRILTMGAQQLRAGELHRLNGLALMVFMGMMVEDSKDWVANRKLEEDPVKRFLAGLDRSGVAGILGDASHMAETLGIGFIPGGPISSRYAARNFVSSLLGPTAGLLQTTAQTVSATQKGFTESDVKALTRAIPYNNLFYWRILFGQLPANAAADAFNVPKTRR